MARQQTLNDRDTTQIHSMRIAAQKKRPPFRLQPSISTQAFSCQPTDLFFQTRRCYTYWLIQLEESRTLNTLSAVILIAQIILGIVLTVLVVMQTQNSGAGGMFGSDTTVHRTRRGLEKTMYQATIVIASFFFVVSIVSAALI